MSLCQAACRAAGRAVSERLRELCATFAPHLPHNSGGPLNLAAIKHSGFNSRDFLQFLKRVFQMLDNALNLRH